ncbi:MAG: hypothetical protein K0S03_1874 [Burkholderiales bacterium]|jgi:hypothetical protein|nr:hypothetical protein [Burkholderiales bacterium]
MADERDPKVSQRYRELGRQEPPRHVDDAILAASRRAVRVRLAPLVPPTGRRRWYFPVAAAAIIMLSVAVTWHMQVEEGPDPNGYVASAPSPEAPKEAPAEKKIEMQAAPAAKPPPAAASRMEERARESAPVAGARAPEAAREDRVLGKISAEPPEKWLERVAALRKEGKHEEADKVLEEFRKRYPDYKIPESALKK